MTRYRSLLSGAALALLVPLAACASDDTGAGDSADAGREGLPEGWSWVEGDDVASVSDPGAQALPAVVVGDDGVESEIVDTSRTIAGGDDIIEVFDAVGISGDVAAAPEESATATGQAAEQTFLFNGSTGTEGVLSLDGTLFIGNSVRRHTELAAELRAGGISAVVVDNLSPAPDKIRLLAQAIGFPEAGEDLATQVEAQFAEATEIGAGLDEAPRVLHISATGAGGNAAVGGEDTAANAVIVAAGAENVAAEVADYSTLSNEGVISTQPDFILLSENDLEVFGGLEGVLEAYPTLAETPAGQAGAFIVMPDLQLKVGSIASGAGAIALAEYFAGL